MPELILPANGWQPRPSQMPLWQAMESGKRRAIEIAHRRWGKDDVALHWTACQAMQRVGTYWHMLPMASQAKKAIWNAVNPHTSRRRIDEAFPEELRDNTNANEMFIRFKNGSTWQVVGSDNFNSLVGAPPVGVVFSEWALANPSAWAFILPILIENGGWAIFITTPRGKNHAHKMYQRAIANPDWYAGRHPVSETMAISLESQAEAKRDYIDLYGLDMGTAFYEQEYEVSFDAAVLGAYYGPEMGILEKAGRITRVAYTPGFPVHTAWDIGISDSMVIWFWQLVNGEIRVIGCYANHSQPFSHYADECKRREALWQAECMTASEEWKQGTDFVPHDARVRSLETGRTRVEILIAEGRKPKLVADHKVADGINAARMTLGRTWFDAEGCETGIEGLKQYRREWDDEKKVFKETPLHDWCSDYADAYRYLSMAWREIVPEPVRKPDPIISVGPGNQMTIEDLWKQEKRHRSRI